MGKGGGISDIDNCGVNAEHVFESPQMQICSPFGWLQGITRRITENLKIGESVTGAGRKTKEMVEVGAFGHTFPNRKLQI